MALLHLPWREPGAHAPGGAMSRYVIVTGWRGPLTEEHRRAVYKKLDALNPWAVIHGDAPGVDREAHAWAVESSTDLLGIGANWSVGKSAGPERNRVLRDLGMMLVKLGHEVVVAAFPHATKSKGTRHMIGICKNADLPIDEEVLR